MKEAVEGNRAEHGCSVYRCCSHLAPFTVSRRLLKVKVPDLSLSGKGVSLWQLYPPVVMQPHNQTLRGLGLLIKEVQV